MTDEVWLTSKWVVGLEVELPPMSLPLRLAEDVDGPELYEWCADSLSAQPVIRSVKVRTRLHGKPSIEQVGTYRFFATSADMVLFKLRWM